MGFTKIIVAIDKSPLGPVVFAQALELAKQQRAHLKLCYCVSPQDLGQVSALIDISAGDYLCPYPVATDRQLQLQNQMGQIQEWLQNYCQQAINQGVTAEFKCLMEEAKSSICNLARSWGADLIVVGRRGRKGFSEALLGSVSNYVLHHAPCSVLIIQGVVKLDQSGNNVNSHSQDSCVEKERQNTMNQSQAPNFP